MYSHAASRRNLYIVYANVILYATCYQLQRPIEPFMVERLGTMDGLANINDEYARLQSFFSIFQMIGSLFVGVLMEKIGSKGGFILSFAASAISYGLLANATSLQLLYASKIPTIFQAGFMCAQTAIVETTGEGAERVAALGRLTVCYTIGSIIGPALGGALGASGDYYFGAQLAVVGSILSIILCLFMSHPNKPGDSGGTTDAGALKGAADAFPYSVINVIKAVWILLGSKLISGVANSIHAGVLPLIYKNEFGLNEKGLGFTMAMMSAFNALVNGVLLAPIVKKFDNKLLVVIKYCLLGMFIFYGVQFVCTDSKSAVPNAWRGLNPYFGNCVVLSMFQYILATCITAESSARVTAHAKGTLLGLEHSLFAAARIVTPQVGVFVLSEYGVSGVSGLCGVVFLSLFSFWSILDTSASASGPACVGEKKEA